MDLISIRADEFKVGMRMLIADGDLESVTLATVVMVATLRKPTYPASTIRIRVETALSDYRATPIEFDYPPDYPMKIITFFDQRVITRSLCPL